MQLLNYNVPYVVSGIFKFFDRLEIKNLLAYLRIIVNNSDEISLTRIINFPKRNIGNSTVEKLIDFSKANNITLFEAITNYEKFNYPISIKNKISDFAELLIDLKENSNKMSLSAFVKYLIDRVKIKESYNKTVEEDVDRLMNIDQFVQSVQSFENMNDDASISSYLESVTLQSSLEEDNVEDCVNVSTVHASKGLEFDVVFVVGLEEGRFPLSRGGYGNIENLEEERRLMYVATTRAKKQLFVTRAKSRFLYGNREQTLESRFIKEMGIEKPKYSASEIFANSMRYNDRFESKVVNRFENSISTTDNFKTSNPWDSKIIKSNQNKFDEFKVGVKVLHTKFGVGVITSIENIGNNTFVTVNFNGIGAKQLSLSIAPLKVLK